MNRELLGFIFILINIFLILIGFFTRNKKVAVRFTDFNTIILGDLIGLSFIDYAFATQFDFLRPEFVFLVSAIIIAILATYLLHQSYKFDTQRKSNSGYINGNITFHGRLHLAYCFYQILTVSLLVLTLVNLKLFSHLFLWGVLIYLLSVYLDIKKGILFLKNR